MADFGIDGAYVKKSEEKVKSGRQVILYEG